MKWLTKFIFVIVDDCFFDTVFISNVYPLLQAHQNCNKGSTPRSHLTMQISDFSVSVAHIFDDVDF
jgi:hypothetical protein